MSPLVSRFFRGRRKRRVRLEHEKPPISFRTKILIRLLLFALILAATIFVFPLQETYDPPTYQEGMISDEEIIAPFSFVVEKPTEELDLERARAADAVFPVFVEHRTGPGHQSLLNEIGRAVGSRVLLGYALDSLGVSLSQATVRVLASRDSGQAMVREAASLLNQARTTGLVGEEDAELLRSFTRVRVSRAGGEEVLPTYQVFDHLRLSERAQERGMERLGVVGAEVLDELTRILATPNLIYDHAATETERRGSREAVSAVRATVQKDERIVDAHERITAEQIVVLDALQEALRHRSAGRGQTAWLIPVVGRGLLVGIFLGLFAVYLRDLRRRVWDNLSHMVLLTVTVILTLCFAGIVARSNELHSFLAPIVMAPITITLLLGYITGLGLAVGLACLIGAVSGWELEVALIASAGGIISCYAVRNILHRMEFLRAILPIALVMVFLLLGIRLVGPGTPWIVLLGEVGWLAVSAALSVGLALFILPLLERVFGLASNVKLLELSDLNRPIFKRMMLEANGTYHHSMIVGSLGEVAAEAVGGNPLLARVGGYYHDIGKIAKSGYFGENLREGLRNPHEKLTPHMSSLILESHVREGLELAREIRLPGDVAAFIPEHQGTTLMQYFYDKAQEMDPEAEERDYRYPGPRPQSKETGIIMLADASEATVRSLSDHSPNKIRAVLGKLFGGRIADGQLDECGLTMADLAKVRDAFTHVLTGVFHGRVKYQWQKNGGEEALGGGRKARVFYPELETGLGTKERAGEIASTPQAAGKAHRR